MEDPEAHRPDPPLAADEVRTLLGFLDHHRGTLAWKCSDLDDEQLRAGLPSTALTLGGLLMHLARVEDHWFSDVVAEGGAQPPWADMPWAAEWQSAAAESADDLRALWAGRVERSRHVVAQQLQGGDAALAATHPAWGGQARVSLRWVLVHMIEEYARHNGHADLLREAVDGATGE